MPSELPNYHRYLAAPRAGADLRAARERLGWQLPCVATRPHIRLSYLEGLEEGRLEVLPGRAYALGYLRTYAAALGLHPEEMVRRFKLEASEVTQPTELAFPAPVPERGLPAGALVLLGVLLAIGVYAGWYRLSGEGRLPAEATAVPERLAPLAQQAIQPAEPKMPVHSPLPAVVASVTPGPDVSLQAHADVPAPVAAVSPVSAAAAPIPARLAANQPDGALVSDQPRLVIRATADAWLQVRDKSGPVLLNRTLHAGESWPVPPRQNLLLTTGNAGGTELVVEGNTTGALGNPGAVRRDLPLDPDLIKEGRLGSTQANGVQPAGLRTPTQ